MSHAVSIRIDGTYASIEGLVWENVPPLAVLTGHNGAGKTQLLEILAASHGALVRAPGQPRISARATFLGDSFAQGEVFHSYGEWLPLTSSPVNEDQVMDAVHEILARRTREEVVSSLSRCLQVEIEKLKGLTPPQFLQLLTPGVLWTHAASKYQTLSILFLAYRMLERDALSAGETPMQIRARFGEPPWDVMADIISAAALPFTINHPQPLPPIRAKLRVTQTFEAELRDAQGQLVPFDQLSSGERVLMSTATWRYRAEVTGKYFRLLLLDEPDAHLHPSMTRRFLNVLKDAFVEHRGVRVIMTTHSPSTVALTPDECLSSRCAAPPRGCGQ